MGMRFVVERVGLDHNKDKKKTWEIKIYDGEKLLFVSATEYKRMSSAVKATNRLRAEIPMAVVQVISS